MKSRTIAIAGSIAALTFAATPVTALAAKTHPRPPTQSRVDRSRDASGVRHVDKSRDNSKDTVDNSRDLRDW